MNIGIDIDGVLCNEDLFQLIYGTKFCIEHGIDFGKLSPFLHETQDIFSWSVKEDFLFWQKYYIHYLTTSEFLYPNAADVIYKLYQAGHQIFIISQRNQLTLKQLCIQEDMKLLTRNWLHQNKIPFHDLILTEGPKNPIIQANNITLMIDDNPQILMSLYKQIHLIGFRANCNHHCPLYDITVVSSWIELENQLKNFNILDNQ